MKRDADQVFEKYCKLLYKVSIIMLCNEQDAYDSVQESFLRYLDTKMDFKDESHEKAWLTRVNINICKNMLRFRRMHPTVEYETLALNYHTSEETGIMDALMALNTKDKEVLILYYIEFLPGNCEYVESYRKCNKEEIRTGKKKIKRKI